MDAGRAGAESAVGYRPRIVDLELDELFAGLPAISIEGAKARRQDHYGWMTRPNAR